MTKTDLITKDEFISEFSKVLGLELEKEVEAVDMLWDAFESYQMHNQYPGIAPVREFAIRYTAGINL